jgi:hypothetical protein
MFVNQFTYIQRDNHQATYIQRDNHQAGYEVEPWFSGITIVKF